MDYQVLFNLAVALAAFFGGWTLNNITKTLERLDRDIRDWQTWVSRTRDSPLQGEP